MCKRASERASWLVPTSAIDSAVRKVALKTFEAEAREAIAAFVCGTTFSYRYRLGRENRSTPITAGFRRAVAGVVPLCFYSAACRWFIVSRARPSRKGEGLAVPPSQLYSNQ